ncbi:DUF7114 family protein [Natronocalculus amylovorans]|uniref:Uncharacterized protein n=1 Tax=Natronocalculus amylovorans TaxID=2917812 RepID=A0AAE3KAG2_9EURY|nr:hypothetical protein [Natronocalculus amylovorans]MCL9816809.1 hypothetical protein [Natronocalculus amylovorans]
MDDAVRTRAAAQEALSDIEPPRLQSVLENRLTDASMTPGALTLASARAAAPTTTVEGLSERAAGVQLIYEGLRLTRTLAHEEPWNPDGTDEENLDADLAILAADVLVSRGFYLLARTEAASMAVETVRSFGRDQTLRSEPNADVNALDGNLEVDVFRLAAYAGATAVGGEPPEELLSFVSELARGYDGVSLPPAAETIDTETSDELALLSSNGVARSPADS